MTKSLIKLTINNDEYYATAKEKDWPLIRFLREKAGLTGTKQSCDSEGTCGSCTVIIDGKPCRACMMKVSRLNNANVTTVESLQVKPDGIPHPLLQTVIQDGIFQCGYCSSGALMSAKALLDRTLNPTQSEIVLALSSVVCRCAGLYRIERSIMRAASIMRGDEKSTWTVDDTQNERMALEKLTGKLKKHLKD